MAECERCPDSHKTCPPVLLGPSLWSVHLVAVGPQVWEVQDWNGTQWRMKKTQKGGRMQVTVETTQRRVEDAKEVKGMSKEWNPYSSEKRYYKKDNKQRPWTKERTRGDVKWKSIWGW